MTNSLSTVQKAALVAIMLLSVFGIGAGVYMTWHHELSLYSAEGFGEIAGCVESANVSCDVVNTSAWSELFGVPQFTWAIPTYLTFIGLSLFAMAKDRAATALIVGLALFCVLYSAFLAYVSKVELGMWCLWCIRLYVTNGLILGLSLLAARGNGLPRAPALAVFAGLFAVTTVGAVGAQKAYRSTLLTDAPTEALPTVAADTTTKDADGDAPVLDWAVTTEDGKQAILRTSKDDPWKGNPNSKVAVVEFADFQCGYCKRASGELKRLYEAYGDRVVFIYKHYPMDPKCNPGVNNVKHRYACQAAEASVCMQKQGLFWPFHDLAFKNQHQLRTADLLAYAEKAGGDVEAFTNCMRAGEGAAKVRADGELGQSIDIHGTPRIWVNGQLYRAGQSAEQMGRALELALGASAADANTAAAALRDAPDVVEPIAADVPAMRTITLTDGSTFEIDTFEASLDNGAAVSGKHLVPGTRMSWFAAADACKSAGKRMCTEKEWIAACQGATPNDDDGDGEFADDMVEGTTYPYSDYHQNNRCWDGQDRGGMRPVYTGEMPGCVSRDGVYDLTGNVEEWVGASPETAVMLGGAFDTSEDHARCYRRNDTFGPGYANVRTGFRCCR